MRTQYATPTKCPNTNCKTQFYQSSNRGYLPISETEVAVVMVCPGCKCKFEFCQAVSIVQEYVKSLPKKPVSIENKKKITYSEIQDVREKLENENVLKTLLDDR